MFYRFMFKDSECQRDLLHVIAHVIVCHKVDKTKENSKKNYLSCHMLKRLLESKDPEDMVCKPITARFYISVYIYNRVIVLSYVYIGHVLSLLNFTVIYWNLTTLSTDFQQDFQLSRTHFVEPPYDSDFLQSSSFGHA